MPVQRVHNALNGDEIKKMVLAEIDRQIVGDSDFRMHKTYNLVSWEWNFKLTAHAQQRPVERKIEGKIVTITDDNKDFVPQPDDDVVLYDVSTSRAASASPDKVRSSAGLPVPMPRQVPGAGIVDVPLNRDRTEKVKSVEVRKDLQAPEGHMNPEAQEVVEADK